MQTKRLQLAAALKANLANAPLMQAVHRHGEAVFGDAVAASGTLRCTDAHLVLDHLRSATKAGAHTRPDLLC